MSGDQTLRSKVVWQDETAPPLPRVFFWTEIAESGRAGGRIGVRFWYIEDEKP
jgi:hypothetical protein